MTTDLPERKPEELGSPKALTTTFSEIDFKAWLPYLKPLFEQAHKEVRLYDGPLDPDYGRYLFLMEQGCLRSYGMLVGNRTIVGYSIFVLDEEMMQKGKMSATQIAIYVRPEHRGNAYSFLKFCDDKLKAEGVNMIWRQVSVNRDIGKVLKRLGYTPIEISYLRRF